MDMTIDQQVALDEALVPHASRLRIGKSNFCLRSNITSKESTLQVVYDLLKLTPFYKMNNKKRIVNLEYFREMLHICPRIPNQPFDELPFEEEILVFLQNIGHSGEIKKITNNVDFAYLLWEDFVYQVKHKDAKKSNEMYYPRFTKVIVNFFMTKDPSLPRRDKVNWHYVRDDQMFTTIKLASRHQNTQQFGAILPVDLTNKDIRNSAAYKEYYAIASGAKHPKTKASKLSDEDDDDDVQHSEHDEDIDDQSDDESHDYQEDDDDQDDKDDDQTDSENNGDDFVYPKFSTHDEEAKDEENFDPIVQTLSHVENSDDEGNDDASHGMNVRGGEGPNAEDEDNELYGDLNINLKGRDAQMTDVHTTQVVEDTHVTLTTVNPDGQQHSSSVSSQFVSNMLNPSPNAGIDSLFKLTPRVDVPVTTTVEPLLLSTPTLPPPSISIISQVQQAPAPSPATSLSTYLQFAEAVFSIPSIVDRYLDHRMNEAIKVAVQLQSDRLRDKAQAENEDFLNKLDENIQKIIKEQVKVQVSKILPKIEKTVNEQLEAEVLTRASNSSKTSYAFADDLSKLELKKIIIKKMKSNKSINISDEQKNLYKALVDAYECNKIILDTYRDTFTLKRHRDDEDKDEETLRWIRPGVQEKTSRKKARVNQFSKGKDIKDLWQHPEWFQKQAKPLTPDHAWNKTLPATHGQPWISDLAKQADSHTSFNELMDTLMDFLAFLMNRLKSLVELKFFLEEVYKVTTDQLDWNIHEGEQYPHDLLKPIPLIPNSRDRRVIPFDHFINNDLEYLRGGASSRKYTTSVTKTKAANYGHIKDDEKFYKFKEGDLKRLYIQDIEDMLLLLVQGKLTNLTVEERFAFNGIQMKYLPQTIWRRSDKERAATMIQDIDKQLKTRRIRRSLEKFVGGRLYERDFRMLQRTI
nr:hypothetical protein [Tanacetum cinerariifolium]